MSNTWCWCPQCMIRTEWRIRDEKLVCCGWRCKGHGETRQLDPEDFANLYVSKTPSEFQVELRE